METDVDNNLHSILDHQRWLMNNGFLNDMHKDQLMLFGQIVHKDVEYVELDIDVSNKKLTYNLHANKRLINKISKFWSLKEKASSGSVWSMWRFKVFLSKEGNLDFQSIVGRFVLDYCGANWKCAINTVDLKGGNRYGDPSDA